MGAISLRPDPPVDDWTVLPACYFNSRASPWVSWLSAWAEPWRGSRSPSDPGFMNPTLVFQSLYSVDTWWHAYRHFVIEPDHYIDINISIRILQMHLSFILTWNPYIIKHKSLIVSKVAEVLLTPVLWNTICSANGRAPFFSLPSLQRWISGTDSQRCTLHTIACKPHLHLV